MLRHGGCLPSRAEHGIFFLNFFKKVKENKKWLTLDRDYWTTIKGQPWWIFGCRIFFFDSFLWWILGWRIWLSPGSTPSISKPAGSGVLPEWRYTSESAARWIWSEPFGIAFVKITCTLVSPFLCLKNSKNELKNQAVEWIKMRTIFCAQGWLFENWQKMLAVYPAL